MWALAWGGACAEHRSAEREQTPTVDSRLRRDTTTVLPPHVRAALDARFARWRLAEVDEREWMWALPPTTPAALWGDFDGDGRIDHAAQIVYRPHGDATQGAERAIFAFLDRGDSVEMIELGRGGSPRDALYLIPAGEETFDSTLGQWRRTPRDAVGWMRADSAAEEIGIETEDER